MKTITSLSAFDNLQRGNPAPEWVTTGIARAWNFQEDSVSSSLIAVSENVTMKVLLQGEPVMVVRLGRPGYVESAEHLESELSWIEALKGDASIPTPSPIRGADGQLIQTLMAPGGLSWATVAFEYVPGEPLENSSEVARHYREIGELTARLHTHSKAWNRPEGFRRFKWDFPDLVGSEARWGDWRNAILTGDERKLLARAEAKALSELQALDLSPANWGLIHSDLRPSNVMTRQDQLTVIDFDDCGDGYYLYDFGASLTFYEHRPEARAMAAHWIAGYRSVAILSDQDLVKAVALSMIRRLTMLGWSTTHREDALPKDLWEENLPGTLLVAQHYLDDHLWLLRDAQSKRS